MRIARARNVGGKPEEILIVAANNQDTLEGFLGRREYYYPTGTGFPSRRALYLALYRAMPLPKPGIEHIARIGGYREVSSRREPGTRLLRISLKKPFRLHHRIINPPKNPPRRVSFQFTTFERILQAETIDDLTL
jgi:hypothetical protein